jgi:Ethylbenzene dehydrogenase/Prokaryotic cytochrome b561
VGQSGSAKKTDYGTIILHWMLVASLAVAIATGLRIASETPGRGWINVFDIVLPKASVWTEHLQAAIVLVAVSIAYCVYALHVRLGQRLRIDRVRLKGLLGRRYARWGTINIFLYWLFFLVMLSQLVTGTLLYFGHAGSFLVQTHWIGMWVILGYIVLHLFSQWRYGGAAQLLRVFRPTRLSPAPPRFELADILALLDEQAPKSAALRQVVLDHAASGPDSTRESAATGGEGVARRVVVIEGETSNIPLQTTGNDSTFDASNRRWSFHLNSFAMASVVAGVSVVVMLTTERQIIDHLYIYRVGAAEVPVVDGETSDPVWRRIPPIYVPTAHGGNFQGTGETTVSIQAVHDGVRAYFLFVWDDPTRSLKQLPLRKSVGRWELLRDGSEIGDEHAYNEDKFSVLLTSLDTILAGDATFHPGKAPVASEPATLSGRGLHYTMSEGVFVDVWEWKATSTNASKYCDDDYFGTPAKGTLEQFQRVTPYRGGFAQDPGSANYQDNFTLLPASEHAEGVTPRRLPKDFNKLNTALGRVDLNPDHGESEAARWYMTEEESLPYSLERDRLVPNGAIVPGVIISGEYSGDRADVRCAGRWGAGRWALEVVRRMDVESRYDVPIRTGISMRVAAFDHSQIRHTRHVRPIRLEVE